MNPLAILKAAPWVLCGLLLAGLLLYRGNYYDCKAGRAADRLAQADAVHKAQERATALSNELVIEQAKAMAVTTKKETVYVDRIRMAPNDRERLSIGIRGMRDLIRGGEPEAGRDTAPAVPRP